MCGRYRRTIKEEELARIYSVPILKQPDLPVSYNITPSQNVPKRLHSCLRSPLLYRNSVALALSMLLLVLKFAPLRISFALIYGCYILLGFNN
jgi:hypothetical protein